MQNKIMRRHNIVPILTYRILLKRRNLLKQITIHSERKNLYKVIFLIVILRTLNRQDHDENHRSVNLIDISIQRKIAVQKK